MPHGKKKAGGKRRGEAGRQHSDEDDNNTPDNMSTVSNYSDGSMTLLGDVGEDGEVDESSAQELFEDKLKDVIDATTQKSAKGRTEALMSLRSALSKKYILDFILNRKLTILDSVERCLKKGKGEEQAQAAHCAVLLLIQLGASPDSEEIYKQIKPVLQTLMMDGSASLKARSACAEALGLCNFVAGTDREQVDGVMKSLENIFKGSYLKGDGVARNHTPEVAGLHTSALASWCLLLSIAPTSMVRLYVESHLPKLPELLTSTDVDLRIAAGEAIALLYELAREDDEDFEGDDIDELCETLKQLATDSNKHRAKKDRRQQRSSFRDILHTVEDGDWPQEKIKFSVNELLEIDSWVRKKQYDTFSRLLGSGTNVHLAENDLLRDIFNLGSPLLSNKVPTKASKVERHLYNVAAFKARTKSRGKFRDKRSASAQGDS